MSTPHICLPVPDLHLWWAGPTLALNHRLPLKDSRSLVPPVVPSCKPHHSPNPPDTDPTPSLNTYASQVQYRKISPIIKQFLRTMDRQHQGAAQFQRLASGWRDGYISHMFEAEDEDRLMNGGRSLFGFSQRGQIAKQYMEIHQDVLSRLHFASFETSHEVLILKLSRLMELREEKVEAMKSSKEELDRGRKEVSALREVESAGGKQEGSETTRQSKNQLRQREKIRVGASLLPSVSARVCIQPLSCMGLIKTVTPAEVTQETRKMLLLLFSYHTSRPCGMLDLAGCLSTIVQGNRVNDFEALDDSTMILFRPLLFQKRTFPRPATAAGHTFLSHCVRPWHLLRTLMTSLCIHPWHQCSDTPHSLSQCACHGFTRPCDWATFRPLAQIVGIVLHHCCSIQTADPASTSLIHLLDGCHQPCPEQRTQAVICIQSCIRIRKMT